MATLLASITAGIVGFLWLRLLAGGWMNNLVSQANSYR
jgi:hypothetical protein